jgi:hypothetical protein
MKYQQCGHIEWSCITTFHELSRVRTMCGTATGSRGTPDRESDRGFPLRSKGSSEVEASSVQRRPSHAMERVD